jgi:apolipoprotein N-acyltransferase
MHPTPASLSRVGDAATVTAAPGQRRSARPRWSPAANPAPEAAGSTVALYLTFLASGLLLAIAWLVTETIASAVLGWVAVLLLIHGLRSRRTYLPAYCCGLVGHAVGFYWIFGTVARFGGFGPIFAGLIFALYVVTGALFFPLIALVHHQLGPRFEAFALRSPIAAVLTELLMVRLFPWHFAHTQIAFTPFVQLAGIGGAMLVTFVMFWVAEVVVRLIVARELRWAFVIPAVVFAASIGYGFSIMRAFASPAGPGLDVLLVQGDPALVETQNVDMAWRNVARIYEQSRKSARANTLIVWPESSIPSYVPPDIGSVRREPGLPWLADGSAFLVGGYSFLGDDERYNAAFAVYPDGSVPFPYFKQILIPFGEYMPGASLFPWLNGLNANAGIFHAGTETTVFAYPMVQPDGAAHTVKVAPLVCYEDTVPSLAREATRRGAQVLVNLTYDTWFGRSAAPYQHHVIAAFRAIENRRYLVRATSTGYSAVVNPLGKTIAALPFFTESKAIVRVTPLSFESTYTKYAGDTPWWALLVFCAGSVVVGRLQTRSRAFSRELA